MRLRKKTVASMAAIAIALTALPGCESSDVSSVTDSNGTEPENVVIVGGDVSNQPSIDEATIREFFDLAIESNGCVDIVVADGDPHSSLGSIGRASSDAESDSRRELENNAISNSLVAAYMESSSADDEETDLMEALDYAARDLNAAGNDGANTLVIVHSGLQTSGMLQFQVGLLGAEPSEVKDAAAGKLPDLSNVNDVVWVNCGVVSGEQGDLSQSQQLRLKEIWSAVLAEAGCENVEFLDLTSSQDRSDGLPYVTAVEVENDPVVVETSETATFSFSSDTLLFQADSAEFASEEDAASILSTVAEEMKGRPESRAHVQASTASYPWDPAWALELSNQRAQAVADALVSLGIEAERISAEGLGFSNPDHVDDLDSSGRQIPEKAALNRKVTIELETGDTE